MNYEHEFHLISVISVILLHFISPHLTSPPSSYFTSRLFLVLSSSPFSASPSTLPVTAASRRLPWLGPSAAPCEPVNPARDRRQPPSPRARTLRCSLRARRFRLLPPPFASSPGSRHLRYTASPPTLPVTAASRRLPGLAPAEEDWPMENNT